MAVFLNKEKTELIVDCNCGCESSVHISIYKDDEVFLDDNSLYCFMTYLNGNFYREQEETVFGVIGKKLRKIWAIIRNKDYYYSDITMNKDDFEQFKEFINNVK